MKIEYYEDMLEEEAINKYLNMIANDYNGELAKIFQEKYINKDKEIERLNNIINGLEKWLRYYQEKDTFIEQQDKEIEKLNNIINELEKWLKEEYEATIFDYHNAIEDVIDKLIELKGEDKE